MVFIFPNKTLSFVNSISSIVTDGYKPFALGCLAALLLTYVEISKLKKNLEPGVHRRADADSTLHRRIMPINGNLVASISVSCTLSAKRPSSVRRTC